MAPSLHGPLHRLLAGIALAACAPEPLATLRIDGSNGVMPLARSLADAWASTAPGAAVTFGGGLGGRQRLAALDSGRIDIALASHGLDFDDLERRSMVAHGVAVTPVVFAVSRDVAIADISPARLCDVFAGRITDWAELGGTSGTIHAFVRPEAEVDTEIIRDGVPCMKDLAFGSGVRPMEETGDMQRALTSTPGAIGVTTATVVQQSAGALRAIALDGVEATPANVEAGRYRLLRPAYFVTRREPPVDVQAFLDFVNSARGEQVVRDAGALPASRMAGRRETETSS